MADEALPVAQAGLPMEEATLADTVASRPVAVVAAVEVEAVEVSMRPIDRRLRKNNPANKRRERTEKKNDESCLKGAGSFTNGATVGLTSE